jgi:hypothetical protein
MGRARRVEAVTFRAGDCGATALNPASIGRIAGSLFRACYLPDTCLLSANNLPVILPLGARRLAPPYFDNRL